MAETHTWWDFPFVERAPDGFIEVPDNGFQLCVLWAAGSAFGARSHQRPPNPVFVTVEDRLTGVTSRFSSERTAADEKLIDTLVNDYLAEAGIPPRPSAFSWFLRPPPGEPATRETWDRLSRAVLAETETDSSPRATHRAAQRVLSRWHDPA